MRRQGCSRSASLRSSPPLSLRLLASPLTPPPPPASGRSQRAQAAGACTRWRRCVVMSGEDDTEGVVRLGRTVMTRDEYLAAQAEPLLALWAAQCMGRHEMGDWGELDREDWQENERSQRHGWRLLSSYPVPEPLRSDAGEDRLWIITEADRSVTTLLWPSE